MLTISKKEYECAETGLYTSLGNFIIDTPYYSKIRKILENNCNYCKRAIIVEDAWFGRLDKIKSYNKESTVCHFM